MRPKTNETWKQSVPPRGTGWVRSFVCRLVCKLRTHRLPRGGTDCFQVRLLILMLSVLLLTQIGHSQTQPTGVLRLRVKLKIGESTKSLARKRFYLLKGTLEQNK